MNTYRLVTYQYSPNFLSSFNSRQTWFLWRETKRNKQQRPTLRDLILLGGSWRVEIISKMMTLQTSVSGLMIFWSQIRWHVCQCQKGRLGFGLLILKKKTAADICGFAPYFSEMLLICRRFEIPKKPQYFPWKTWWHGNQKIAGMKSQNDELFQGAHLFGRKQKQALRMFLLNFANQVGYFKHRLSFQSASLFIFIGVCH